MKIAKDKRLHFAYCMLIALFVTTLIGALSNWYCGTISGLLTAMGCGVGKEYGDNANPYNKWDWYDLLADLLGSIVGVLLGLAALICLIN